MSAVVTTALIFGGLMAWGLLAGVTFAFAKRFDLGDANSYDAVGSVLASIVWPVGLGVFLALWIIRITDPREKEYALERRRRAEIQQAEHEHSLARIKAAELRELDYAIDLLKKERQ